MLKTAFDSMKHIAVWLGNALLTVAAVLLFPFIAVLFLWVEKHHQEYFDDFD